MASPQAARSPKFYMFGVAMLAVAALAVVYFHYVAQSGDRGRARGEGERSPTAGRASRW